MISATLEGDSQLRQKLTLSDEGHSGKATEEVGRTMSLPQLRIAAFVWMLVLQYFSCGLKTKRRFRRLAMDRFSFVTRMAK